MSTIRTSLGSIELRRQEAGIVSLLVTMIMIIVMSLIVLGFWQIAQRNQRQTLDRQLSTQAYYAAEAGVNDAAAYLKTHADTKIQDTTDCTYFAKTRASLTQVLGPGVKYTCLSVDTAPQTLSYAPLPVNGTVVWPLDATGQQLKKVTFKWSHDPAYSGPDNCSSDNHLPTQANWNCSLGLLRVDMMPADSLNPAQIQAATGLTTVYMRPTYSGGGNSYALAGGNTLAQVSCDGGAKNCTFDLNLPTLAGSPAKYYVRITPIYQAAGSVTVSATTIANAPAQLAGAQAMIDSTGQAQDVLRRIQVHLPIGGSSDIPLPVNGLQSTASICKLLVVGTNVYKDNCTVNGSTPLPSVPTLIPGGAGIGLLTPTSICWQEPGKSYATQACWHVYVRNKSTSAQVTNLDHCEWDFWTRNGAYANQHDPKTYAAGSNRCLPDGKGYDLYQFNVEPRPPGLTDDEANGYFKFSCSLTNYYTDGKPPAVDSRACGGLPF